MKSVWKAGFSEKDAILPDNTTVYYAEGPLNDKPPILVIHGQTGT